MSWPSAADEAAFLGQGGQAHAEAGRAQMDPVANGSEPPEERTPSLDELVARVPADVREMLDDLFRAKFTAVRRIPPEKTPGRSP